MGRRKKKTPRPPPPAIHAPVMDSHCHLEPETYGGDAGVDTIVQRAVDAGVCGMVAIGSGYGQGSIDNAIAVARRHPQRVWATAGLHPHQASQGDETLLDHLRRVAPEVVAIGEIGLDFHYDHSPRPVQRDIFRRQIALALAAHLPLVIHDRESDGEALQILLESGAFQGAGVLFHCFSGPVGEMHAIVSAGGYVSLPGVVT